MKIFLSTGLSRRWIGFSAWFLLFVFLPLTLAWYLVGGFFRQEKSFRDDLVVQSSRNFLRRIAGWTEIPFQLQKVFQRLRDQFVHHTLKPEDLPKVIRHLQKAWGWNVDIYPFGDFRRLLKPRGLHFQKRDQMEDFWQFLVAGWEGILHSSPESVKKLFGDDIKMLHHTRGLVKKFFGMERDGYLFWDLDPLTIEGGIAFLIWDIPKPISVVQARLKNASLSASLCLFAETSEEEFIPLHGLEPTGNASSSGTESNLMELVPHFFRNTEQSLFRYQGKTWVALPIKDFTFFLGVPEKASVLDLIESMALFGLLLFGCFGFFSGYRWLVRGQDAFLSIRFKLIALFLYTLMIPFMGMAALSYKTFRETGQLLLDHCRKEGMESIKSIDDGFLDEPVRLQKECAGYVKSLATPFAQNHYAQIMERSLWREIFVTAELRDETGETFQNLGSSAGKEDAVRKVLQQFFRNAIKKYLPDRLLVNPEKHREGVSDLYIQSVLESGDLGFTALLENPGMIRHVLLPRKDLFFFWDYFTDPKLPAPIFFGSIFRSDAKDRYLKKTFLSLKTGVGEGNQLFAFDRSGAFWLPYYGSLSPTLQKFAQQVRLTGENQFGKFSWNRKSWIAVGSTGKQIPEYSYIILIPESRISRPLQRLLRNIFIGMSAVLLLTILFAWSLAGMFLNPIQELEKGIQAIKTRNSHFRLRQFQKDEFGDLSRAFNDMMENLEELNAGKLVQEALFPKELLIQGDYRVFGISRPATDLGGDYFDFIRIDETQFLVLIGDVTGHGIPAALIMAMSKAIITTFPKGQFNPDQLLHRLNQAIQSVKKSRRMMTLAFFVVNSLTHAISYYHFGHPNPIHWKSAKSAVFLSGQGTPIGFSAKLRTNPTAFFLAPGERLVLYTDGLVESISTDPTADGFNLFLDYICHQPWLSLTENCPAIIDNHPFFKLSQTQPDDFTVVILERTGWPAMDETHLKGGSV